MKITWTTTRFTPNERNWPFKETKNKNCVTNVAARAHHSVWSAYCTHTHTGTHTTHSTYDGITTLNAEQISKRMTSSDANCFDALHFPIKHNKTLPTTLQSPLTSGRYSFSSFFTDNISKLHSSLGLNAKQHSFPHTDPPSIPPVLDRFTSVTQDEIIKMILKSPDKQCDLDPIPTSLLKECVNMLAPLS